MHSHADVVVIGGGPAGITFTNAFRKMRPDASVMVLRPERHSMVYCAIPYAIEGLFEAPKVYKRDELVTDCGATLVQRAVAGVDLAARRVVDDAGDTYTAEALFLATGASPLRPPVPGIEAANVYTVKTQDDMEALIGCVEGGARRAVVVGAGAIGIEQAQAYASRGIETYLVDIAPQVLPAMLDPDMTTGVEQTLRDHGVTVLLSAQVTELQLREGRAVRVLLSQDEPIDLDPEKDFVCFAVGMRPDIDLFRDQGMEIVKDGIVVDSRMRTSIPHVYAAGDCCAGVSLIDGGPISGKLATNAVPMAKTAARVVAGKDDEYPGFVNGAATCAYEQRVGATGFTETLARQRGFDPVVGWGETTALFPMMPDSGSLKVKIVADARDLRIIGGQASSTHPVTDKMDIVSLAIQQRLTLKGLARMSYSAQPWQSHFPARNAIVQACENGLEAFAARGEPYSYHTLPECVT
jgi:NADPH-dependent 2,4-dienoyl-CoA reductase/sulfur reductase-like enzyme